MSLLTNTYKWVSIKRGDDLPRNAIYSCNTYTDGPVYIGGFDNIPGKVNLKHNKIWNFWVRELGSRQFGKILVMNTTYTWKEISRGDLIPSNALYCGFDNHGDKVWVGRSTSGVPGKINCEHNEASNPTMCNLWTHEAWSASQEAHILIIDVRNDETQSIEKIEDKQHKLNYLYEPQTDADNDNTQLAEWSASEIGFVEQNIRKTDFKVKVGEIINTVCNVVTTAMGDISTISDIIDLIKNFSINISLSSNKTTIKKKIMKKIESTNGNLPTYVLLDFISKSSSTSRNVGNTCRYNNTSRHIKLKYAFLQPKNQSAQNKSNELINENTCKSIEAFKHFVSDETNETTESHSNKRSCCNIS